MKAATRSFGFALEKHNVSGVEILGPLELGKSFGAYRSQYLLRSAKGVGTMVKAAKTEFFRDSKFRARMLDVNIV